MSYKLVKKLRKMQKLIEKQDNYVDCRIIAIALDMDPENVSGKTKTQMHHNMCCQGHLVLALLEILKVEAQKLNDDPEFQTAFRKALNETFDGEYTIH